MDENIDIMFFSWRWLLPMDVKRYVTRNRAYFHQMRLIQHCLENDIKVVIHDQDMKIPDVNISFIKNSPGITLTMPALKPPSGYSSLLYPVWEAIPNSFNYKWKRRQKALIYIGNNYERFDIVKKYLGHHELPTTEFFGDWLEGREERESPETVRETFPHIDFCGRLSQNESIKQMSKYRATIHFAKPNYMKHQFLAIRWIEAILASTPALVPEEYGLNLNLSISCWEEAESLLRSQKEMKSGLKEQIEFLHDTASLNKWYEFFRGLT